MKHRSKLVVAVTAVAALVMLACGPAVLPFLPPPATMTALPGPEFLLTPTGINASPTVPVTPIQLPTALLTATPLPTSTPEAPWFTGEVRVFPGPLHYSGDLLTVEVAVQNLGKLAPDKAKLEIDGSEVNVKPYPWYSPLRADVLVFRWAWDTSGQTGLHDIKITLPASDGTQPQMLIAHVDLLPAAQRPPQETGARWQIRNTACCQIYYITHTAAARDIAVIDDRANQAVATIEKKTGFPISNKPIPLVMIDNVWGNGAYTSDDVVVSYVDRSYIGLELETVLRHELTHWVMNPLTKETPVILVEGIAVYIAGGHYKPEPLPERGAALLKSDLYIPLSDLADNFRARQHEIAYAEAGALVSYLVETYGWAKFVNVYSGEKLDSREATQWLDQAFKAQYNKGFDQVEADFKAWLGNHDPGNQVEDMRLTISLLDTVRKYQSLDSSYQEALPTAEDAMNKPDVSEFLREPTEPQNIALEAMLVTAGEDLRARDYAGCGAIVQSVNSVLSGSAPAVPLYDDYLAIARVIAAAGYEAQRIDVSGDSATVQAIRHWPTLTVLKLARVGAQWQIQQ